MFTLSTACSSPGTSDLATTTRRWQLPRELARLNSPLGRLNHLSYRQPSEWEAQWATKGSKRLLDHRPVLLATETDHSLCLSEPQFLDLVDQSGSLDGLCRRVFERHVVRTRNLEIGTDEPVLCTQD